MINRHVDPRRMTRRTIEEILTMNIGKTLAVVAAGGMLAGLVACGGDKPAPANSPDPAASGTPAPAKSSCNAKGSCNANGGQKSACNASGSTAK